MLTNTVVPTQENEINFFMMNSDDLVKTIESDKDFPVALNYRFLLAWPILEPVSKSKLIHMSSDSMETAYVGMNIGRVVSIGKTVGGSNGSYKDCRELKIGDYVHYNPHVGLPLNYNGSKFISVTDESIMSKLSDPYKHTDGIFKTYSIKGLDNV